MIEFHYLIVIVLVWSKMNILMYESSVLPLFQHLQAKCQVLVIMRYKNEMDRRIRNCLIRMKSRTSQFGTEGRCLGISTNVGRNYRHSLHGRLAPSNFICLNVSVCVPLLWLKYRLIWVGFWWHFVETLLRSRCNVFQTKTSFVILSLLVPCQIQYLG